MVTKKTTVIKFPVLHNIWLSLMLLCLLIPSGLQAAPTAAEYGTVLNLSGKQRMLTQKMTKEMLLVAYGHETQKNLDNLEKTAALFDKTLTGLKKGDATLGLPATTQPRITRQLKKVSAKWSPYYEAVKQVLASKQVSTDVLSQVATLNLPLLKNMNKAVLLYEKDAKKGQLKSSGALATQINLAGKQRMLTQKMSKEFLLVALKHDTETNKLNLLETMTLFDRTLTGLQVGNDTLGLAKTKSPEILTQLKKVDALWQQFKPLMAQGASPDTGTISAAQVQTVAEHNLPLLKEMNAAVKLYEKQAK